MNSVILQQIFTLKALLDNLKLVSDLKASEQEMLNNQDATKQLLFYQNLKEEYAFKVRIQEDDKEIVKRLSDHLLAMQADPIIANYLNNFRQVNNFLEQVLKDLLADVIIVPIGREVKSES